MTVALGILLAAVVVAVVLLPFLPRRRRHARNGPQGMDVLEDLARRREAVYQEVLTLELERDLSHVPPEEYRRRLGAYKLQAAELLREQERLQAELEQARRELEAEVQARRTAYDSKGLCPHCREPVAPDTLVCGACGSPLAAPRPAQEGPS